MMANLFYLLMVALIVLGVPVLGIVLNHNKEKEGENEEIFV